MLCPECMGPLVTVDGRTARCTIHGGQYQIMYSQEQTSMETATNPAISIACPGCGQSFEVGLEQAGATIECSNCQQPFEIHAPPAMCRRHPNVTAEHTCARCGSAVCGACASQNPEGGQWCPDCALGVQTPPPLPRSDGTNPGRFSNVAPHMRCAFHPTVQAVQRCVVCNAFVCSTCDFAFPGGVHVCPACASKPPSGIGKGRKKSLVISYVLAVWSSIGVAVMLSGVLASTVQSRSDLEVLGMVLMLVVFAPCIAGTAIAVGSLDRRLSNPPSVWISVVWNSILLAVLLLLTIIGNLR